MRLPQFSVKILTDHLAVTHNYGPHQRIRAYFSPPKLSKLQSSPEMLTILDCKRGGHR